jgi:cobalt-zinc-cadmium efflux system membrane fusion protein
MKKYIITACIFTCFACNNNKKNEVATEANNTIENSVTLTAKQQVSIGIEVVKLSKKSMATILRVNGKIDVPPQNMISVCMPLGGFLKSTKLLPGMHIAKGEVIAVMEDQQYIQLQQDYILAKTKLAFLENEWQRQRELNKTKTTSDKVLQQTEIDYKSQKIMMNALAEKLKLINVNPDKLTESNISRNVNIYATIDGFVTKVNVNIGKYVAATDVMFELVNPNDIHLNLKVFEKDIPSLFIGQKVTCFTNHQSQKKYACEIILIGKDINTDRNTDVHCHFETYDKTLIPGTYMNAEIEVTSDNAFVLSEEAIVEYQSKRYVFIKDVNTAYKMIEVTTGTTEKGLVEIINADTIKEKEIVIKGAYSLLMSIKNKQEE